MSLTHDLVLDQFSDSTCIAYQNKESGSVISYCLVTAW